MKTFIFIVIFVFITRETQSKPFLLSTAKWLYERFITNSSSPDHSTRNIEDLSEEGPIFHHNKYAKSNVEKILKANLSEDKTTTPKTEDDRIHFDMEDKDNETVSETPGILHRKISKILNKLQLYSAVRSTIHNVRRQQNGGDDNDDSKSNARLVNASTNVTTHSYLPPSNKTKTTKGESNDMKDNQDELEEGDEFDDRYDEPFVFDDDMENKVEDKKKMQKRRDNSNKLSLETGNIGIHIMEIFGSIATIFLTAAYQVGNYANSLTQGNQHQGIPTSQPIEGDGTTLKWKIN